MGELPAGTITFLFTDIEGSTTRWERFPGEMRAAVARHDRLLREAIAGHGGVVFKTGGDAFYAAFATAAPAVEAALAAQRGVAAEDWGVVSPLRVRMALHTGAAELRDADYFGPPLNRVARLLSAGAGGQVLLSQATEQLARDALPAGVTLRELGEHRLKDLGRPERVFQLVCADLPSDFPPLRTLDSHRHNLPAELTPFVGRQAELEAARTRLRRPEVRLLTLTGPGGIGKTRLALQLAADLLDDFADGVFFVALTTVRDAALAGAAVAQALEVPETSGWTAWESVRARLRDKRLLLVLDNFEQVVEAGPAVADLLAACPGLKVLVTSRAVLRLTSEHQMEVPPLPLPPVGQRATAERLSQYEAVRLFIQRAQAARPEFHVTDDTAPAIAEICHRLDGLPLALELVAARLRVLSPMELLERLGSRLTTATGGARDRPERQRTLRNAITWSYELLEAEEQALFRALAVFAGGWTLEAAEEIIGASGATEADVLDGLTSLLDKSLVEQRKGAGHAGKGGGEGRFAMLETIREYALEQLEATELAGALRRRHAQYYRDLAERAAPFLRGTEQALWLARLQADHDNLRAALGWAHGQGETALGLRLATALWRFWYVRGYLREGRDWLERFLEGAGAGAPQVRAGALQAAAALAESLGEQERATALAEESLTLQRGLGDTRGVATALNNMGNVATSHGDLGRAAGLYEESQVLWRSLKDDVGTASALNNRATVARLQGDGERATALAEESLKLRRVLKDSGGVATCLHNLALVALDAGDLARAGALAEESLGLWRTVDDRWGIANGLYSEGILAQRAGSPARAGELLEESLALRREAGDRRGAAAALAALGALAAAQGDVEGAAGRYGESLDFYRAAGDRIGIAGTLEGLAAVAAARGQPEHAIQLYGAAAALREETGAPLPASARDEHTRVLSALRATLEPALFARAWAAGHTAPLDEGINAADAAPL
jgi:predicted ATPase/class 3 adenylate cyclase